jgi:nitrate/nitrite transporter NarK
VGADQHVSVADLLRLTGMALELRRPALAIPAPRMALGFVGASFAVGTPYVARFFPKER